MEITLFDKIIIAKTVFPEKKLQESYAFVDKYIPHSHLLYEDSKTEKGAKLLSSFKSKRVQARLRRIGRELLGDDYKYIRLKLKKAYKTGSISNVMNFDFLLCSLGLYHRFTYVIGTLTDSQRSKLDRFMETGWFIAISPKIRNLITETSSSLSEALGISGIKKEFLQIAIFMIAELIENKLLAFVSKLVTYGARKVLSFFRWFIRKIISIPSGPEKNSLSPDTNEMLGEV